MQPYLHLNHLDPSPSHDPNPRDVKNTTVQITWSGIITILGYPTTEWDKIQWHVATQGRDARMAVTLTQAAWGMCEEVKKRWQDRKNSVGVEENMIEIKLALTWGTAYESSKALTICECELSFSRFTSPSSSWFSINTFREKCFGMAAFIYFGAGKKDATKHQHDSKLERRQR